MATDSDSDTQDEADSEPSTSVASNRNKSIHLSVRRSDITSTSIQDEVDLDALGIQAYDQSTYERRVFEQVDEAISHVGLDRNLNNHNQGELLDLLQSNPDDQEVQKSPIDNDERVLQLARLQRNQVVVKQEKISIDQSPALTLPKIPRLSKTPNAPVVSIKKEPDAGCSSNEADQDASASTPISLFWSPSLAKPNIIKREKDSDNHCDLKYKPESSDSDSDEDGLHLDEDIDYETDEEPDRPSKVTSKKVRKLRRVVDDGDGDQYKIRIKEYYKERARLRLANIQDDGLESKQIDELIQVEGDLQIPKQMWNSLFEHQRTGVKWLWELHQLGTGGILGDEMGLGKTIQMIAFLTALRQSELASSHKGYENLGPCVLVCPATVMYQWLLEFRKWWPPFRVAILHSTGAYNGDWKNLVSSINKSHGILIVSYPGVVIYQDILHAFDWHYAILDEGHKIRNPDAMVTLACKRFRTPHRIILSGSPVQNNLKELWSIFDFIYPGKLGTLPVFMQQFATPITQGGYANASDIQVQIAYKCSCVLRDTIKPFLLRRTKAEVNNKLKLPERSEQVLFCKLTERQYALYDAYLRSPTVRDIKAGLLQIFVGLTQLRKICNHPDLFDKETDNGNRNKQGQNKRTHVEVDLNSNQFNDRSYGCYKRSGKMMVVDALLRIWKKQGHKVLLFTQSRKMLKLFQKYLTELDYKYLWMDGTTSIGVRQSTIDQFNKTEDIFVFLLTTRVGGVGINLVGANRIIIFDPDWNPSTDIQARERAWRIGQHRQVIIYRLLTAGTIEEKIYHRQVFKLYLTNRILRDAKQKRFFKTNDLHELFTLGDNEKNIETKALFDDDLQINPDDLAKRKKMKKEKDQRREAKRQRKKERELNQVKLSDEKIEAMRKRAKELSRMISAQYSSQKDMLSTNGRDAIEQTNGGKPAPKTPIDNPFLIGLRANNHDRVYETSSDQRQHKAASRSEPKQSDSNIGKPQPKNKEHVRYLVRQDVYRGDQPSADQAGIDLEQQDYILDRLFKSSNVFGALKHDKIESDSTYDFKIVESEAEKVARDAIRVLRESRKMCMSSLSGVPNWTGRNGQIAQQTTSSSNRSVFGGRIQSTGRLIPKNRTRQQQFLQKIGNPTPSSDANESSSNSGSGSNQSGSLIASIKKRTQISAYQLARETFAVGPRGHDDDEEEAEAERNLISHGKSEGTGADKMADMIRDHMLHKSAAGNGDVQTNELLEFFNANFRPDESAVFKALLYKICTFKRYGDIGFWTIKNEFKDQ